MPNLFAYIVLYSWPVLVFFLYRHMSVERAFIWSILLGYLFMPPASAAFDLPALPEFSKIEIAAVSSFIFAVAFHGLRIIRIPRNLFVLALLGAYVTAPVLTTITNLETISFGFIELDGISPTQIPALVFGRLFSLIPYIMAYSLLSKFEHLADIMMAILIGALAYSVLILFEVRFSPQLNIWIFGFFQHVFAQMVRGDGFRPIVFLYHALWVGFFTVMAVVAAVSLFLNKNKTSTPFLLDPAHVLRPYFRHDTGFVYIYLTAYLMVVLVVSKSLGPIVLGFGLVVALLTMPRQIVLTAAAALAFIVLSYPILRTFGLVPTELLIGTADIASSDRGSSLAFRLFNEAILLDRANEKVLFGWGAGSRHLVLDPIGGRLLTIPDGQWIITLGVNGAYGFIAEMGLLTAPIFAAFYWRSIADPKIVSPFIPAYVLLIAANIVDMIPNATLTPLTMLMAGAVWRHLEDVPDRLRDKSRAAPDPLFGGTVLPYNPVAQKNRTIL